MLSQREEIMCWQGCGEMETLWYIISENVIWCSQYGKQYGNLQKIKTRTTKGSSNPTFGYIYEENKNRILKTYLYSYVHSNIIHNSQEIETTYVSIDGLIK